jgi:GTP-binding protein
MSKSIVAIVGRPNVGKSTLFNRLVAKKIAIVDDMPGVTRDRLYRECEWLGHKFMLIDTGGLHFEPQDKIKEEVALQVNLAIDEANLILFVVDAREGLLAADRDISQIIRRSNKPVILVMNKVEGKLMERESYEFYEFGYDNAMQLSAEHGLNTGDLLDKILELLPPDEEALPENTVSVAIVGRPNVGKSSLLNALLGEKRVIVDSVPGTTRDAIDTLIRRGEHYFNFIDTAGIRKKSRVNEDIEYYSVIRAFRALARAQVGIIVIDADQGLSEQDKKIAGRIIKEGKSCLVVVNKWDLYLKTKAKTQDISDKKAKKKIETQYIKDLRKELYFIDFSPVFFTSALENWGVDRIFPEVLKLSDETSRRVDTSILNKVIREAMSYRPPPAFKGKTLKIYFATQPSTNPPVVLLFGNSKKLMHFSYERYLENKLREAFGFEGSPLRLIMKEAH